MSNAAPTTVASPNGLRNPKQFISQTLLTLEGSKDYELIWKWEQGGGGVGVVGCRVGVWCLRSVFEWCLVSREYIFMRLVSGKLKTAGRGIFSKESMSTA